MNEWASGRLGFTFKQSQVHQHDPVVDNNNNKKEVEKKEIEAAYAVVDHPTQGEEEVVNPSDLRPYFSGDR